jgi:Tfp pilus assembly protein PilV
MNQSPKAASKLPAQRNPEAGFTILEAIIATMILIFGLAAIFNLMVIAVSQNSLANRASGATTLASHQMEILRSTAFSSLTDSPVGVDTLDVQTPGFFRIDNVEGTATYESRWSVQTLTDPSLKYLRVRTEPQGFLGRGARAEFTTVRSCTLGTAAGCP